MSSPIKRFSVRVVRPFWYAGKQQQVGQLVELDTDGADNALSSGRGELANPLMRSELQEAVGLQAAKVCAEAALPRRGFL